MRRWLMIIVALLLAAAGVHFGLLPLYQNKGREDDRQVSAPPAPQLVHSLGRITPATGVLIVGTRPGARVDQILVKVDQIVKKGQTLAVLEGRDQCDRQLALARAQEESADFQRELRRLLLKLERDRFDRTSGTRRKRLVEIRTNLQAKLDVARKNRERITSIDPAADRVAVQDFVMAQNQTEIARTELELDELDATLALLPRQRALEDREWADGSPTTKVLDEQIALAQAELERTVVKSPAAGVILDIVTRAGEASAGPLLRMADLETMTVEADVDETEVPRLSLGARATARIFSAAAAGRVTRIARLVGKNKLTSVDPLERVDRRVVEVIVTLDDPSVARHYVGMQVEVAIEPTDRPAPNPTDRQ